MSLPGPFRHARSAFARLALVTALAVGALGTSLEAQITIPIPQILAETETYINNRQPAAAADLLDRVLARLDGGEEIPQGVDVARLRLSAATAHFQAQNLPRAAEVAETLIKSNPSQAILGEARMLLGLSFALQKKYAEAVPVFRAAEESPTYRDRATLYGAMSAQQAGQIPVAIEAYNRLLAIAPRDREWADAALSLISLHVQEKNIREARRGLNLLRGNLELVDNLAGLNVLFLQLGDALVQSNDPAGALAAYRTVSQKADLLQQQSLRNRRMEADIARMKAILRGNAADHDTLRRLEARLEQAKEAVKEIEKLANYDATLLFRLGNAFQERGGAWEAALIFEEIINNHPGAEERERAYLGLIRAYSDAGRFEKTSDAANRFMAAYPNSEFGAQALYLAALAAGQRNDLATQLKFLDLGTTRFRQSELREPMLLMQANALFTSGRFEEARTLCVGYVTDFPKGKFVEDATYLSAMAALAEGKAEVASQEIEAYLRAFPDGRFQPDARYRLAATDYARENFVSAASRTESWMTDFGVEHPQAGEVLSLQGDIYAGLDRPEDAITSYRLALDLPLADEQLGYVLDELTRLYQARRDADSAVEMWETFARERPDHPFVINAAYWIGRIRSREGRVDEALDRVSEIARRYVADPSRDEVERLLVELASMLARPPRAKRGEPKPTPPTEEELFARVDRLLLTGNTRSSLTAAARALFVKAEISGLRKNDARRKELLDRIASLYEPDQLPPGILGKLGDHMLEKNAPDVARTYFQQIITAHPRSIFSDFGYAGLGEIALREGRGEDALRFFNDTIDVAGARFKLREATLGRGRALLQLGRLDAAKELFEQVASNRAWRGEATAESIFNLGEILMKRGGDDAVAQAQGHYQRVFISYRRWVPWVAKAYLRSADAFETLGQYTEAAATLREMLRDQRLAELPETAEARRRLPALEARAGAATDTSATTASTSS